MLHNSRILTLALTLFATIFQVRATLDDNIATWQGIATAMQTSLTTLSGMTGDPLTAAAGTLSDSIAPTIEAVNNSLTNEDGSNPTSEQIVTLTTLYNTLNDLADNFTFYADPVGPLQEDIAYALATLSDLNSDLSGISLSTIIENAATRAATAKANSLSAYTTYSSSRFTTTTAWTQFLSDKTRAADTETLTDQLQTFATYYTDYTAALAAVPLVNDDTIVDYDSSFLDAQDTLQAATSAAITALTSANSTAVALSETDCASVDQIDIVADAATTAATQLAQISASLTGQLKRIALARKDIALRVAERELLFNATTYSAKQRLLSTISTLAGGQSTAADELRAAVGAATVLINIPVQEFDETPFPSPSEGEASDMQLAIDAQVAAYLIALDAVVLRLFTSPPSQTTLDAIHATLSPAVYIQTTGSVMANWLTNRATLFATEDFGPVNDTTLTTYASEWGQLVTVLTTIVSGSSLSSGVTTAINNVLATPAFANLFVSVTSAADFTTRANKLIKRPDGGVRVIQSQGDAQFQLQILSLLAQMQRGSISAPAATTTNAAPPTPSTRSVPEDPDTTIDNTSVLTTTLEDGSQILITGTGDIAARLRDPVFNSDVTDKLTADLKIFMNNSARIGLGAANISNTPGQTPNILGGSDADSPNSIQIVPDGNCFVDVNGDLLIAGSKPIVPTPNFGTAAHTLTFYSETPRNITIASNTTWDLTDFGSTGSDYVENGKQIVFGGQVNLVLEPGAKIRLPMVDPSQISQSAILYFNDKSQIVFQGDQLTVGRPWVGSLITGTDCKRCKILGMGSIWLNKNAAMIINKPALVGIEADYTTPQTDVTFSLQRNAQLLIGTQNTAGGALQIGNMYEGGSKAEPESDDLDTHFPNTILNALYGDTETPFTPHETTISFTLTVNGEQPLVQIGRQGFFGLAAGVVNKDGAPGTLSIGPNGSSDYPESAWQLQHLYDVDNITLNVTQGTFDHSIITNGDNANCSVMAVSRLAKAFPYSKYLIKLGPGGQAVVRGGGNLYFVDRDASMTVDSDGLVTADPHTVSIQSTAEDISFVTTSSGIYAPLAPAAATRGRSVAIPGVTDYGLFGRAAIVSSDSTPYVFAGPTEEFFYALKLTQYNDTMERFVPIALNNSQATIAIVNNGSILRNVVRDAAVRDGFPTQALSIGYLRGEKQINGIPTRFSLPIE